MKDTRMVTLANRLLDYSVHLQKEEKILIEVMGQEGIPLAIELMKKANTIGAYPFFNMIDYDLLKVMLQEAKEEQIKLYGQQDLKRMEQMDAYIGISANPNRFELGNIPAEKMKWYQEYYLKPVYFEERTRHTKWCILRYPNRAMAQSAKMNTEQMEDFYFQACNLDYANMANKMQPLVERMNRTDKVHIIGNGTDLTFSIKGIGAEKYVGNFNLPDGEVATAPVRDSVNGVISYNTSSIYNGYSFDSIRLEFKKGKIIKATANDTEKLNGILNLDEGARYIGEFALGVNPFINVPIGDTLFDEKIKGSFHFTPGDSLEQSDNGNRSSLHWDLICIQTPEYGGGEIWFDDELIRKDGRFIPNDLQGLNPENLIKED